MKEILQHTIVIEHPEREYRFVMPYNPPVEELKDVTEELLGILRNYVVEAEKRAETKGKNDTPSK